MIARGPVDVTFKDADATRLPDAFVEGASVLLDLVGGAWSMTWVSG